jgi:hypothetical protein
MRMNLNEFNEKYYLHDSVIDKIEYQSNTLTIYCQFCEFMQDDYKESDFANSDIIITFHNSTYSLTPDFQIEDAGIIDHSVSESTITLRLENFPDQYGELKISADIVEVRKLRYYNL